MIGLWMVAALSLAPADLSAPEPTEPVSPPRGARLLVFVGEQLALEPIKCLPYTWHDENEQLPGANSGACGEDGLNYRARYRVELWLEGGDAEEIEFLATGWTAPYGYSRHALIYLLESPDGVLLASGLAHSVYPTEDGGWASCDALEGSEPLAFRGNPVFGRTDGMSPHGVASRFPPSAFEVIGSQAYCIRGRRLPALSVELDRELQRLLDDGYRYPVTPRTQAASP